MDKNIIANIPAYATVLEQLKQKIKRAQYKAALSANKELIMLYWEIGTTILEQQSPGRNMRRRSKKDCRIRNSEGSGKRRLPRCLRGFVRFRAHGMARCKWFMSWIWIAIKRPIGIPST